MKPNPATILLSCIAIGAAAVSSQAEDLHKANNTDTLSGASAWVENTVPSSTANLIWDSTRTALGLYSFGNGQFTGGVTVQNPGGTVSLRVASGGTTTWANNALIDMSTATVDVYWTEGTLRVASANYSPTITVASGRTLTLGGNGLSNQGNTKTHTMAGAGNIIVNANMGGGGAMNFNVNGATVTMNNAASGWTFGTVTSGKLVIGNGTVLDGKRLTMNAANGLGFGTGVTTVSLGGLEGSGAFALTNTDSSAVTLTIGANNTSYTLSGDISGTGSLIKVGAGTQTISGNNSFSGGLSVNAGAVTFGQSAAAAGGAITATNATTLSLANSSSIFLSGTISPSGSGANVSLTSANISAGFSTAFTGAADQTVTISGGTQVNIASSSQQFSGFNGTVAVTSGATLRFSSSSLNNGGDNTTFDLTGGMVTRNNGFLALGALSGNGNISMGGSGPNTGKLYLTIGAKGINTTYGGVISDSDVANGKIVNVFKTGAGSLTFSGVQNYTGDTTISAGTLALSGSGSIASSPNISLAGGATFDVSGGSFTLGGSQTLANSGASSASVAGNVDASSGTVALSYAAGTPSFITDGNLTLSGATTLTVNNTGASLAHGSHKIIGKSGGGSVTGTLPSVSVTGGGASGPVSLQIVGDELFLNVNNAPVAQNITTSVARGDAITLTIIGGKHAPSDTDADTLTVSAVGTPTAGSATFNATSVTYTAPAASSGTNTFTYTVSDDLGGTDVKTVTVVVTPATGSGANITSLSVVGSTATISALGIPELTYKLQHTDSLSPVNWTDTGNTDTASDTGVITLIDSSAPLSGRYYRTQHVP